RFFLDTGAEFLGKNEFAPTYFVPCFDTVNGTTQYVMRCNSYKIEAADCETVAFRQNPYFNRTLEHFCSHAHAPNDPEENFAGAVIKDNVAYISWDIFTAYAEHGHLCFKELFSYVTDRMLGKEKTVSVTMPDRGVVTLARQKKESRSILHLLFAHTTVRGEDTEVIEDTVPLYNVECAVKCTEKPVKVYLAPSGEEIHFTFDNGEVKFTVPKVDIHQMVVLE
ncbi:MAG: beta-galactosidase, partial [Clostridia bacterium]|nr:beta-galactosidase [Clostridia bacterium]